MNRVYAWSFALLAVEGGVERAKELMVDMVLSLPEHTEKRAEALYRQERAARRQMIAGGTQARQRPQNKEDKLNAAYNELSINSPHSLSVAWHHSA